MAWDSWAFSVAEKTHYITTTGSSLNQQLKSFDFQLAKDKSFQWGNYINFGESELFTDDVGRWWSLWL